MPKANPENGAFKKILNHLTTLDKKVDKGFKEVAEFRQQTEGNFAAINKRVDEGLKETDKRFKEATDERQSIRNEMQEFRKKTEGNFAGLYREIPQMGSELYDKIEGYHKESLKFQRESYLFQQQSLAFQQQTQASLQESHIFQQQTRDFQNAILITVQDFRESFQKFLQSQTIIQETFNQLKSENEKLK